MNTRTLNNTFILIVGLSLNLNAQTNILYVKPAGVKGDGSSWEKATNDLQEALKKARKGTQIWVAAGLYVPTDGSDRHISFEIPDGVALFGGFAGNEKSISQRSFLQHPTILSGNIGSEDPDDNSYNVVYSKNASSTTLLDGFIISGGNANGEGAFSTRQRSGGGLYNESSPQAASNPTIANCTFIDNFAKDGGAVYNNGKGGEASPTITDCYFEKNTSYLDGGAVYNDGRAGGISNPIFTNCTFSKNEGNYGGAVFNYGMNGRAEPRFANCVFSENESFVKGGAVFHLSGEKLDKAMFGNSVFNKNQALDQESNDVHHYLVATRQNASAFR